MTPVRALSTGDVVLALIGLWLLTKVVGSLRRRANTTPLKGPASKSWIFGVSRILQESVDSETVLESWAEEFGGAYRIPTTLGEDRVILCDPKAISHFYSKETFGYVQTPMAKIFVGKVVGNGILSADGESHRRQRKALTPAFSNAAIRRLTSVFYDSAYKAKDAWDTIMESTPGGEAIIDVQDWMNHISLDSIGIAGFSHDFGTLGGKRSAVAEAFNALGSIKPTVFTTSLFLLGSKVPILMKVPTSRRYALTKFSSTAENISKGLLERTRREKDGGVAEGKGDHSVIGLLIKAENEKAELRMSEDEVMSQMKVLILAGYETTSISLTWALIELSKDVAAQQKLREEIKEHYPNGDPTYDQLNSGLPYLDAVVHETLRLHPPLADTTRVASENDIIPLSVPIQTADNRTVDHIAVAKGQVVTVPIRTVNRSISLWGPDAKEFKPQRWLNEGGIQGRAAEVQSYRHLLSFIDGPRTCLGKGFALAEFKSVLTVLIRNFSFELRDGPETKFDKGRSILPRPKVAGEDGNKVPLRVQRVE